MAMPGPHDLLRLSTAVPATGAPEWIAETLRAAPWVVVRRGIAPNGLIPVGVRGINRSERYATEVYPGVICEMVAPEDLAHVAVSDELPALSTLKNVRCLLADADLPWGPTGSVGFALATGLATATPDSDLDLLVRAPQGVTEALPALVQLHDQFRSLAARVDCQVETPSGAVALAELVGRQPDIMVRTARGPCLMPRIVAIS
ncbi:malonate decarboxylase holo-ACP synthase [Mycolicibacterium helvum]|uniref:Malonate decarboxylase holo-ACP synthase n=2 Tax=Mycolicibacterium helvum TaxID=1534349 RepID=A0A7I7SZK0_9MYCO|nr:malonate decarboxylase holo-ACP synthase [Mycolicibacterium helvum]